MPGLDRVNVTHDYGTLKEVIVGRIEGMRLPTYSPETLSQVGYAPEESKARAAEMHGQMWEELDPENYQRAVGQVEKLVRFLEVRGIVVHRPDPFTDEQHHVYDAYNTMGVPMFMRDPVIVIGSSIIETSLRQTMRNKERWAIRRVLREIAARPGTQYVSMPYPFPVAMSKADQATGLFLEGGDVFPLGRDILVGYNGRTATSLQGIEWLQRYLGSGYQVHPVRLTPEVLHLDDGLATVREGLAIILREQFADGLPEIIKNWDVIEVTKYEALNYLAGNGLVLKPNEILIDSRIPHIAEQLTAKGVTVHTIEYDAVSLWAGGLRCSHHPIVRELE